jgi:tungstate transport system substrate-binding protein
VKALIFFLVSFLSLNVAQAAEQTQKNVILSTTTSTQDSGLLDVLVPLFEKQTGYSVKTVSVGTGQALALAAKGDADVALVHAPTSGFCVKV